jgi:hypothetical protein
VLLAVNQLRRADDDDRDVEHISQGPARQIRPPKELPKAHAEAVVSPLHPLSTFLSTLIPVSCGITPPAARPTRPRELGTTRTFSLILALCLSLTIRTDRSTINRRSKTSWHGALTAKQKPSCTIATCPSVLSARMSVR